MMSDRVVRGLINVSLTVAFYRSQFADYVGYIRRFAESGSHHRRNGLAVGRVSYKWLGGIHPGHSCPTSSFCSCTQRSSYAHATSVRYIYATAQSGSGQLSGINNKMVTMWRCGDMGSWLDRGVGDLVFNVCIPDNRLWGRATNCSDVLLPCWWNQPRGGQADSRYPGLH